MTSKLGMHWLREHPDNNRDLAHVERMQYRSIKLFKPAWDNPGFCRDLLTVLPRDAYILARDHDLSEQKEDMWRDAEGAGANHADQWIQKVRNGQYHLPTDRTFFLGINEPDATHGDRDKIDRYNSAYLRRLQAAGLRGGAFNFSTGHPRTVDGTPNTPADYSVFERSHWAIVEGHHIGVLHIYGTGAVPCAPGHYDRLEACTWQDVEWVVGEFGVDEHVIGGGEHAGFHSYFNGRLNDYCGWLDTAIMGINDPRIHSYEVYTHDFSHPWGSFDIRPIRDALEGYTWQHMTAPPAKPIDTHLPIIGTGPTPVKPPSQQPAPVPRLSHPIANPALRVISQRFGDNAADYARFGLRGHAGIDFAVPVGTPVAAADDGMAIEMLDDPDGYGQYIKLRHAWGESLYAHLDRYQALVVGAVVKRGQVIALSGNTGNSTGAHLHFAIRVYPYQRGYPFDGYSDPGPYLEAVAPPPPAPDLVGLIKATSAEFGLDWRLVASLAWAESSFDPQAESKAGARGLLQLMWPTWGEWAERVGASDIYNPSHNLKVGCAYLAWLLRYYKGNTYTALVAYNFGPGNVDQGIKPPPGTLTYVERVLMGRDLLEAVEAN